MQSNIKATSGVKQRSDLSLYMEVQTHDNSNLIIELGEAPRSEQATAFMKKLANRKTYQEDNTREMQND